ncbi:hypothetical protein BDR22DRAFT_822201 [Usnea florida]
MSGLDHPEPAPSEPEVENEIDRLVALAEEVDKNIDRLLTQAGLDVISVRHPESSASSKIVEASSEVAQSIGDGNVESNTHVRPSASAGTFPPSQPSVAAHALRSNMEQLGTRYTIPLASIPESIARESLKENAKMSIDPFPFLTASDHSEAVTTCPICQEAFENAERPEIPLRLPCQHVFGISCLASWMSIKNTCPLCRTVLGGGGGFPRAPEVPWSARVFRPVRRPGLPRFAPLMNPIIGGSLEANIREIEATRWELAEETSWLLASQASLEHSQDPDDVLAQIDACLGAIIHLNDTLLIRLDNFKAVIWGFAT